MSRLQRLIRILACRTGLRTGRSVETRGRFPLTKQGTFGGFALRDYGALGAVPSNVPMPGEPSYPKFTGEAEFSDGTSGLSLTVTVGDGAGESRDTTLSFPGVDPLRAVSGVSDELNFAGGKVIRRVGVCRDPVLLSGMPGSYGSYYPALGLLVGDGSTVGSHRNLLSSHWCEIRGRELINGDMPGMSVQSGILYVNLPRETYRRYVKGCVGETVAEGDGDAATFSSLPAPGVYRCDFFDGTSRVVTLTERLDGIPYCADVVAVSRSGAVLQKRLLRRALTGEEPFEALTDYEGTGETIFRIEKEDLGGRNTEYEIPTALCTHFVYVEYAVPEDLIWDGDGSTPTFCEDDEYWYFYLPGENSLAGFSDYLADRNAEGTPVVLVYPAASPVETPLTSYLADTATVGAVTPFPAIADDYAFDAAEDVTLIPAMGEFFSEERAAGREIEIYYVLPEHEVSETELRLPRIAAGEGATTFSVASAQAGAPDPASGWFAALCDA